MQLSNKNIIVLKRILNFFHEPLHITELELAAICESLFTGINLITFFKDPELLDTVEYLKEIVEENNIQNIEDLEAYYADGKENIILFLDDLTQTLRLKEKGEVGMMQISPDLFLVDHDMITLTYYKPICNFSDSWIEELLKLSCYYQKFNCLLPVKQCVGMKKYTEEFIKYDNHEFVYLFYYKDFISINLAFSNLFSILLYSLKSTLSGIIYNNDSVKSLIAKEVPLPIKPTVSFTPYFEKGLVFKPRKKKNFQTRKNGSHGDTTRCMIIRVRGKEMKLKPGHLSREQSCSNHVVIVAGLEPVAKFQGRYGSYMRNQVVKKGLKILEGERVTVKVSLKDVPIVQEYAY